MAFQASVEAEKWARKGEADYAVSLSHRLGFRGELNSGTLCRFSRRAAMALCVFVYAQFEVMDYSGSTLQLLTSEFPSAGSRV